MDALTFEQSLRARGIETVVRKSGRLDVWPAKAYKHLTDAERVFIAEHKADLIALAAAKTLPETTVVWQPPQPGTPTAPPSPVCPYCGRTCLGRGHCWYATLHANDPDEIARRDAEATRVMFATMCAPRQEPF